MNGKEVEMPAVKDMKFDELVLKYLTKAGINLNNVRLIFIYNSKRIEAHSLSTLEELRIINGSKIKVFLIPEICETHKSKISEDLDSEEEKEKLKKEINDLKNKLKEKELVNQKLVEKLKDLEKNNKEKGNISLLNEKIINLYEELKIKDKKIEELEEALKRYPIELSKNEKLMSIIINSSDQKINHSIICKNTDKFIKIEGMIYNEYPEYEELISFFLSNGKKISKFKTLEENQIKNSDVITFYLIDE